MPSHTLGMFHVAKNKESIVYVEFFLENCDNVSILENCDNVSAAVLL